MDERTGPALLDSDLPDGVLTVRAAEGDEDAFAVLVRRHSRPLLTLAYYMLGSAQDAEDAVQDAFVSAWRRLPDYHHRAEFRTWMYRITVNRCLTMRRRRRPTFPLDAATEPAADNDWSSPAGVAEQEAAAAALVCALGELEAGQRLCWILRELQGLSYEEIAHVTHSSEPTVRGRLFRARQLLKEAMASWR
ncbi:RNA polymerase sigma-70 factor, ECF subfamily [Streptomyces sp. 2231.1]|uniref:RNA polymerase sigma factor n=1 Tax=Streptomyces sp. 2231.1 TaxID=1855347 RepID=UPI000896D5CD|nr:RNA polymerase sigma factor [Streptomyces sp. 2231.1]SEB97249.1 RNA polymerase sigma-70 factor, ECF subfamily [Streptomyces sp. 2231.1]